MALRFRVALALFLATGLLGSPAVRTADAQDNNTGEVIIGVPTKGPVGVSRTINEIMQQQSITPARSGNPEDMEDLFKQPDRTGLPQNPGSPELPIIDGVPQSVQPQAPGVGLLAPQTIGTNFTGATLSGTNPTLSFPPDCMGAVGPTQYVVFVNGRIVTFNKTTGVADGALNADPDVFFSSVVNGSFTSDPRLRYDRLTGRWILVIINVSTPNRILLAVSDAASGGTITGSTVFTFFFINIATQPPAISNTCLADYPTLGVDANALYIGTNNFCGSPSQTYNSSDGYVIRKSSILGAGPMVVTVFRGLVATSASAGPYTPQGVDNFDPTSNEGYFIGVDAQAYSLLQLRRVSTPGGTPTISANIPITVSTTNAPINVNHLGNTGSTAGRLDALDDRLFAAHIRNGRLWTAHNIQVNASGVASASGGRDGSRWYEINGIRSTDNGGVPIVLQTGTILDAAATNPTSYWIPSVMVSGQGHAAFAMSNAGANNRANAATVGRLGTDVAGTTQTPALVTASATAYNPPSDPGPGRRWGDYSFVSLDPLDDMTMWQVHMFCDATNSYGVRVTKLIAPAPATPNTLADIAAGANPVNVTLTGLSVSGSGYYDPGTNLAAPALAFNHLSASITNGAATGTPPTVVSATYVNPTTVNLVLNATAATANIGAEKYTLTITNPDGQASSAAVVHVTGGAPTPVANIAAGPSLNEGNAGTTNFNFTVNLSSAAGASGVTVNYATSNGTATTADNDYTAATSSINIPSGQTSGTITVLVNGDTKFEPNETFTVTLTGATNATLGATLISTGTIQNDDTQPTINIAPAVANAEGNAGTTTFNFAVTLTNASSSAVSATVNTANGTATTADNDYVAITAGSVSIPAGSTTGNIAVTVNGDTKFEANETFTVALTAPSGGVLGTASSTGTINNDDTAPTLSIDNVSLAEGNAGTTSFGFTVSLSAASGVAASVNFGTSDGSATLANNDYQTASGTVNFAPGVISQPVSVLVNGDLTPEANEAFTVGLTTPVGATILSGTGTGTIQNDDAVPSVSLAPAPLQAEGNAGTTNFSFTVNLSSATGVPVTVFYQTSDGSATTADNDYVAANSSIVIPATQTSGTIVVGVNGDTKFENLETFSLTLNSATNATVGAPATVAAGIQNDDSAPTVSIDSVSLLEGNVGTTAFAFNVSLSAASGLAASVQYATADGSATLAHSDYAAASGTLNFAPGVTAQPVTVDVNGDLIQEGDETFTVTLTLPSGATLGTAVGTGTIQNDDNQPSLSIDNVSVTEGNSGTVALTFTVSLSNPTDQAVSVDFATADAIATVADNDYVANSGTLTIPAKTNSGQITVLVNGDLCGEADERLHVNLTNPINALLGTAQGTGTILNDDDTIAPAVTVVFPNGADSLGVNGVANITWTATDIMGVTTVDILLSRDGGATFPETVAAGIANTGSFPWIVTPPNTVGATGILRVNAHDGGCNTGTDVSDAGFTIYTPTSGVPADVGPSMDFALGRIEPNPSQGVTRIEFTLPHDAPVSVSIVDLQGREVATVVDREMDAGRHTVTWNAQTARGPAAMGVYFVHFEAGGRSFTKRIVLAR